MDESGKLIAVIGDEDTVTGFVLAGVGHRTVEGCNFLVVKSGASFKPSLLLPASTSTRASQHSPHSPTPPSFPLSSFIPADTEVSVIERTFREFTERADVGIILINQHVANEIRSTLRDYTKMIPTVLEIPSKDIPYDPEKDYVMQRVSMVLGGGTGDDK